MTQTLTLYTTMVISLCLIVVLSSSCDRLHAQSFASVGFPTVLLSPQPHTGPGNAAAAAAAAGPWQAATLEDVAFVLAKGTHALVIGYSLSSKRERLLLASGMLCPVPARGVCYVPIHACPGGAGGVDVVLHKATDNLAPGVAPGHPMAFARTLHATQPRVCLPS